MKAHIPILIILILSALSSSLPASAQAPKPEFKREIPDMDAIREATYDKKSPYYYPRLMEEYHRNDTLMKLDKFRHLYFGYMFQEDYNPYRPKAYGAKLSEYSEKEDLTRQECDTVIKYSEMALEDNPFDLRRMVNLISALKAKGKNNLASIWQYKLDYILMAIVSTGTGLDEENAWYVIQPEHEYVLLNAMGLVAVKHLFYEPSFEYITVQRPDPQHTPPVNPTNKGGDAGYYFNIGNILEEYYRKYPDEE